MRHSLAHYLMFIFAISILLVGCSSSEESTTTTGNNKDAAVGSSSDAKLVYNEAGQLITGSDATAGNHGDGQAAVKNEAGSTSKPDATPVSTTRPLGSVCTQQDKSCNAGLLCAFLEKWDAPKGTCLRQLDKCTDYNDSRCAEPGKNYSVMCGEYKWMTTTSNICFLLCKLGNINYDCPAAHKCVFLNNFNVCVPE